MCKKIVTVLGTIAGALKTLFLKAETMTHGSRLLLNSVDQRSHAKPELGDRQTDSSPEWVWMGHLRYANQERLYG